MGTRYVKYSAQCPLSAVRCQLTFSAAAFMMNASNNVHRIFRRPDSHSCHARRLYPRRAAAPRCVSFARSRAAFILLGSTPMGSTEAVAELLYGLEFVLPDVIEDSLAEP